MPKSNKKLSGTDFEIQARQLLQAKGLQVITTNYHAPRLGEIDIIATQKQQLRGRSFDCLVFIEVRSRQKSAYADALTSITPAKQQKIIKTAAYFLQAHPAYQNHDCRFDVMAFDVVDGVVTSQWLTGAFLAD